MVDEDDDEDDDDDDDDDDGVLLVRKWGGVRVKVVDIGMVLVVRVGKRQFLGTKDYVRFVLISGDFMGEWVEISKCWKWRSFTKVIIPIPIRRNSLYDKFFASIMQSGDLDCTSSDVMISYVMHSRKKVNPTIINSDVRVLTYIMDVDADGFRPILRINIVERSFEGPLNSSAPPPRRLAVDDDLNNYENDVDDTINMEYYSMHMEDFSLARKMMKKTVKRNDKQDTSSPTEPISIVVKHSPIKKS
ncbi:hypothetical protein CQW23_17187 [Capsicum baccatum]|uniref:Uncharacterized protein n=1 Tax=Capsicum baccatum TaxID=33114 RepID=A0A2G2WD67_CAPBA|nr:hypothetical protein CQW23_17187 [Capsicum baccatum]